MKILVTGSSGHLGEAIVRVLKESNHDFVGVDITASEFTTHLGSITDRDFVNDCIKNVDVVIHSATLHKPHVVTHSNQEFIDTNLTGTLNLLEESRLQGVKSFIFTSTTSTFGDMLTPISDEPAAWITEEITPIPKNFYGLTKSCAEDLCWLFYRNFNLPCIILKTSRFFPEDDDKKTVRDLYKDQNVKVNEYLYRRVDIEDAVTAHMLAVEKASSIGFGKYIISATSPFTKEDLADLHIDAPAVVERLIPEYKEIYETQKWKMLPKIDRVYVNKKARAELGWQPKYDFKYVLDCIKNGRAFTSRLAQLVGAKGYHSQLSGEGPYQVIE